MMTITPHNIRVRDLFDGYKDNEENGVVAYGGRLDVRPPFQREFVYSGKQRDEVIRTIVKGYPLNVMYWNVCPAPAFGTPSPQAEEVESHADETYEIIDGQQRTISICQYLNNDFSLKLEDNDIPRKFGNLPRDMQEKILDYELYIYVCNGSESEKLKWFEIINIAGEVLNRQELRNAVFAGEWLTDAKRFFSKQNGAAAQLSKNYVSGAPKRQELLEKALAWIAGGNIEAYMNDHRHDQNAQPLKDYFTAVMEWIEKTFPKVRATQMKGVNWGELYAAHKDETLDSEALEAEIKSLMMDSDVTNKSGIYPYVLDPERRERVLSIRCFDENTKRATYEKQNGCCALCGKPFKIEDMHADHIVPWSRGGHTTPDNCQMLCVKCNLSKSDK